MKKSIFFSIFVVTFSCSFGQTQFEMNQEAKAAHARSDARMTVLYKKAMASLSYDPQKKQQLLNAQRAWIRYKESHCKAEAEQYEGGSMQPMVFYECLTELTDQRAEVLRRYLQ